MLDKLEMHPALKITEEEAYWPRERQILAAQIRSDQVRIVGHWPRRLEKEMPLSCRFCTPEDHKKEETIENTGPRGSKDKVVCPVCKWKYTQVAHYNRHLKEGGKGFGTCSKTAKQIFIKVINTETENKQEKIIIQRRPHTGPVETLDHVLNDCATAKTRWGPHNGTLDGMVTMLQRIKHHFDAEREKINMLKLANRNRKIRDVH